MNYNSLLKIAEDARAVTAPFRPNQLTIRTRTWSGGRVKLGVSADEDLVLPPHFPVRTVKSQDIFSSAGRYEYGDIVVDDITPSDGADVGYTRDQLKPAITDNITEVIYVISGPMYGEYRCIDLEHADTFSYKLVLRRLSNTP